MVIYGALEKREHDGSHLTAEQMQQIESYARDLLQALELNFWRVYMAKDLPPKDCLLMIEPTDGGRTAMLYVSEGRWDERDAEEKRVDLTHECLHLIHHDQEYVIRHFKDHNGDVGEYPMSMLWEAFAVETERMVDSLSYLLAPNMPEWREPMAQSEET